VCVSARAWSRASANAVSAHSFRREANPGLERSFEIGRCSKAAAELCSWVHAVYTLGTTKNSNVHEDGEILPAAVTAAHSSEAISQRSPLRNGQRGAEDESAQPNHTEEAKRFWADYFAEAVKVGGSFACSFPTRPFTVKNPPHSFSHPSFPPRAYLRVTGPAVTEALAHDFAIKLAGELDLEKEGRFLKSQ